MFYELAQLAFGNLIRARARLAMTAGGVLVGTAAVILLIALTIGLQNAAEAGIGASGSLTELQVYPNYEFRPNADGSTQSEIPQLTQAAVREFWKIKGVAAVIPMTNLQNGQLLSGDYYGYGQIVGIDPALLPYLGAKPQQGSLTLDPNEVIVGGAVGQQFYDPNNTESYQPLTVDLWTSPLTLLLYDSSGQNPRPRKINLKVSAVLQSGGSYDSWLLLPLNDVMKYNEWSSGTKLDPKTFTFDQVTIRTTSRETTNAVSDAVRKLGYMPGGMGEFLNQLNGFFTTMRLMLGGIGGVALLVAAFGVANTMTMAILERTKEIGLMKAIGATDRDVLTVFLIEAGLVGLSGGVAGVGVALALQNAVNSALKNAPQSQGGGMSFLPFDTSQIGGNLLVIPPELVFFAILLAMGVGLGAGLYPALRAARLPPVVALKSE